MSLLWLRCVKFTLWICYSYVELYTIIGYSLFPPNHNFAEKNIPLKSISEYWNLPECHKICFCCQTLPEISLLGSNGIHWSFKITFPTNLCFEKHTYTQSSSKMERSGVVWWLRIEITVVFDSSFQNTHYRIQTLPLARWMRMQQTIYLSYRGSRVPGEGKWGPRGTRITDGASLDPLLATQVVCTYYRWCKMLLTRCGWYVIICGASSGIE